MQLQSTSDDDNDRVEVVLQFTIFQIVFIILYYYFRLNCKFELTYNPPLIRNKYYHNTSKK